MEALSQWQGLIGVVVGVVITGALGLLTTFITQRSQSVAREEARREARADLRRRVYADYLVKAQKLGDESASWVDSRGKKYPDDAVRVAAYSREVGTTTHEYDAAHRHAMLAAGPQVQEPLAIYNAWLRHAVAETIVERGLGLERWDDHEAPLVDAMRAEIDADTIIRDRPAAPGRAAPGPVAPRETSPGAAKL